MRNIAKALPRMGWLSSITSKDQRSMSTRNSAISASSKILLLICLVATPLALWTLTKGLLIPLVMWTVMTAGAFYAFALQAQGKFGRATNSLVCACMLSGAVLTAIVPQFVDFGFAMTLLGPIFASLVGNKRTQQYSWMALAAIVVIGLLTSGNSNSVFASGYASQLGEATWVGAFLYASFALALCVATHQLAEAQKKYNNAQNDTFKRLIEHVQYAVFRLSAKREPIFISKKSEQLFACKRYELEGSGLVDRLHVQDRPNYLTAISSANSAGISRTIEVRMRKDDNLTPGSSPNFIWVEMNISPVTDGSTTDGQHEVLMLLRDISKRKHQEQELQNTREKAEEASKAKTRFLATIGHELRTPLNAIVGFSDMMSSGIVGDLADAPREYASIINKSGLHLLELVNMLLDMSKMEAGKFDLQTEPFVPDELVGSCVEMIDQIARERDIKLVAEQANNLPSVLGDKRAYKQILINLLSNAVKFSKPGSEISVGIKRQGPDINIRVADSGIGMSRDVMDRLGEPFFQANTGHTRTHEGAGLGLSIVKGLVELHEGRLHISSEPGKGTTMTVLLPIAGPKDHTNDKQVVTSITSNSQVGAPSPREETRMAQQKGAI